MAKRTSRKSNRKSKTVIKSNKRTSRGPRVVVSPPVKVRRRVVHDVAGRETPEQKLVRAKIAFPGIGDLKFIDVLSNGRGDIYVLPKGMFAISQSSGWAVKFLNGSIQRIDYNNSNTGYTNIIFAYDGVKFSQSQARVIYQTYSGEILTDNSCVIHLNGNPIDSHTSNLHLHKRRFDVDSRAYNTRRNFQNSQFGR